MTPPEFDAHLVGWVTLAILIGGNFLTELPVISHALGRSWFGGFFPTLGAQLILPVFAVALPYGGYLLGLDTGGVPNFSKNGVTIEVSRHLDIFSSVFLFLCGTLSLFQGFIKLAFLRMIAKDGMRVHSVVLLFLVCAVTTTSFLGGLLFNQEKAIAAVESVVMGKISAKRGGASTLAPGVSSKKLKDMTAPIMKHYEELGKLRREK